MRSAQYNKLFIIVYSSISVFILFLLLETAPHKPIIFTIFIVILILTLILALTFYKLTISINDENLTVRFGIGLFKKRYKISSIKKCKTVEGKFSVLSRIWFEKLSDGGKSYVLSSALPSIEITYEAEKGITLIDRVGTDDPDRIADYVNKKIGYINIG
jgi:hypothetical protein